MFPKRDSNGREPFVVCNYHPLILFDIIKLSYYSQQTKAQKR